MYVPADAADVLSSPSPIKGSVEAIESAKAFADDIASDLRGYKSVMLLDVSTYLLQSESVAIGRVHDKVSTTLVSGSTVLEQSAGDAADGFKAYGSEVDRIHGAAKQIRERVNSALDDIRTQSTTIEEISEAINTAAPTEWKHPPSAVMPTPVLGLDAPEMDADARERHVQLLELTYSMSWWSAVTLWQSACESIVSGQREWEDLVTERRAAEQALLTRLAGTAIGQLIILGTVPGGVGAKRVIAHTISGELWGEEANDSDIEKRHSGLAGLFKDGDGSGAWENPPPPEETAAWWNALDDQQKEQLIREVPWVIGNLPGLPYTDRDAANREMLKFYSQNPRLLSPEQLKVAAEVQEILQREAEDQLKHGVGRPPVQVVALDLTTAVPKVAVGYGNSDTATHTTWEVAGMESDANLALEGWDLASRNLYSEQNNIHGFTGENSVIAWLGYDTPDLKDTLNSDGVLSQKAARAGADRFSTELDGNHAAREVGGGRVPVINVIAHSYGTTTATIALTRVTHEVDSLTLIASAGLDTEIVSSYDVLKVKEVSADQMAIYTTHAAQDLLAPSGAGLSGRGQPNPDAKGVLGLESFSSVYEGGLSFSADGDSSRDLSPTDGHSIIGENDRRGFAGTSSSNGHGYLDRNTQALNGVAQITTRQMSEQLEESFVRTEAACSQVEYSFEGFPYAYRTACD